jgi:hypothetical protein
LGIVDGIAAFRKFARILVRMASTLCKHAGHER